MAGLLYYLPGRKRGITLAEIQAVGLGHAFERPPTPREVLGQGPDGGMGLVVADEKDVPASRIGYFKEKQMWRKVPGIEAYVGMATEEPPQPAELAREDLLDGHFVKLRDGQPWLIPVARGLTEEEDELRWREALPHVTTADEQGDWVAGGVLPRYARLWEVAERWWDARSGSEPDADGKVRFDFAGINDAALTALAANYRVGKAEVALLGLFDQQAVINILDAVVDVPVWRAWLKKKLTEASREIAAGSSSAAGPEGATEDTGPPSPT